MTVPVATTGAADGPGLPPGIAWARRPVAAALQEIGGGRPLLEAPPYDRRAVESAAPESA